MGLVADIKKFAIHDGPGIRTTVFFKGCPLDCWWCHNPESRLPRQELVYREGRCVRCLRCVEACAEGAIAAVRGELRLDHRRCTVCGECAEACPAEAREVVGREMSVGKVMDEIRRDVVFYDESGGGATFSGGEPLMQPAFLAALLDACRSEQIHTTVDTTGHARPEVFREATAEVDLFLYDLKIMDAARHEEYCGVPNGLILENLRWLAEEGRRVVLRMPLIPQVNGDRENIDMRGRFVSSLATSYPVDLLPFERLGLEKYAMLGREYRLRDLAPPGEAEVESCAAVLREQGLNVSVRGERR